ncbi:MAG: transglutaminase domain-containing protein [Oscillospiraceae bacterium]
MKTKKKKRVRFDGAAPLPIILYLLSVSTALMFTICQSQFLLCSVIMGALTAGIFLLFYKLRFKPLPTTLCIFGMILAAWLVGSAAGSWSPGEDISFMNFLFTASATFQPLYAAAAVVIFSVVIGFIGCYFSVISPRPCFLMLLMFIPMILSSRTAREMPVYFMLIMTGCFIFASANLAVPSPAEGEASFEDGSTKRRRIGLTSAAAVVLTLIVAVLPKSDSTPFKDYLDSFVPKSSGFYGGGGLSNFTNHSSVNTGLNNPNDDLLFTVDTDSPGLLKCWAFDVYSYTGWTLYRGAADFETGHSNWEFYSTERVPAEYIYTLYENSGALSEESQALLEGITPETPQRSRMNIGIRDGSSTRVIMHPVQTISDMLPEECGRSYQNPRDDIFTEFAFPVNAAYSVTHSVNKENEEFIRRLDYDSFELLIKDAYWNDIISGDTSYAIIDEMDWANSYRRETNVNISPEIQALADEITSGLESDYDKARAIEQWFGEAGFVYDLAFVPEGTGAEYFLLDSRRGICSDFATAMTLLARAAGLPARYCEGYAISPDTYDPDTGLYNITNKQAHAFTQIYFPGGGWLDFDATRYVVNAEDIEPEVPWWLYALAAAAAGGALIFLLRKPLGWLMFCVTYPMRGRSAKIRGVYFYTRRLAAAISGAEEKNLACGEVRDILAKRLGMPREAELICASADRLFYSPEKTAGNVSGLLKALRAMRKRRRRLK